MDMDMTTVILDGDVFVLTPEGDWVDPSCGMEYTAEEMREARRAANAKADRKDAT